MSRKKLNGRFDVVAIASSAGGVTALSVVLGALPADFPAAVLIVQHIDPRHKSLMAQVLQHRTDLRVVQGEEGAEANAGTVYVAPPDRHMLVLEGGQLTLTRTELVNFVRPSADLLFDSVAFTYRERAIAVVLTGSGSDGAMGVRAVKQVGGTTIAQDEATAEYASMPRAAVDTGCVDFVLPLPEIGPALVDLVMGEDKWRRERTRTSKR